MYPRRASLLIALAGLGLLIGCRPQLTRQRFEMIREGVDSRDDVRHTLGKPTSDLGDQWFYNDLDQHYSALIHYGDDGRVSGKEWMDEKSGQWEGRNPDANEPPPGQVPERKKKTTRIDED